MRMSRILALVALMLVALALPGARGMASEGETPVARVYPKYPAAPDKQTEAEAEAKSAGCVSCHTRSDAATMHQTPAVRLGCTDCHGGDATVRGNPELGYQNAANVAARDKAHVLPRYPEGWHFPSSANPKHSYTLLNREAPEFVRFVNPGDYRVAREACGACHTPQIEAAERSLMATGAMLWGGAGYNNGIVPFKSYIFGEAYTRDGQPAKLGARAFDLLLTLAERRDRVVSKNELLDVVWPGLVVEENNLQVHISALRKLLGPSAIATVPGRGYRFTAPLDGAANDDLPAAPPPAPACGRRTRARARTPRSGSRSWRRGRQGRKGRSG